MKEMHGAFRYHAVWEPGTPLELGEIGEFSNGEFQHVAYLADKGIPFKVIEDPSSNPLNYGSKGSVTVSSKIAGKMTIPGIHELAPADAGLVVRFSREKSTLFEATGVRHQIIRDVDALEKDIISAYNESKWKYNWVVITDLIRADSATILISNGADASIELRATVDVPNMALTNMEAQFVPAFTNNIETSIVAKENLTPLFKARGLRKHIFTGPALEMKTLRGKKPSGEGKRGSGRKRTELKLMDLNLEDIIG
jgi:hypothetical protein